MSVCQQTVKVINIKCMKVVRMAVIQEGHVIQNLELPIANCSLLIPGCCSNIFNRINL